MINKKASGFYQDMARTLNKAEGIKLMADNDNTQLDAAFIQNYCHLESRLLDLGSGTGLIINKLLGAVKSITAVEKITEFTSHIKKHPDIRIILEDLLNYEPKGTFDIVTIFGVAHYFNEKEIIPIYQRSFKHLATEGVLIVKNQFGINEDITIDGYSEHLNKKYYAQYRKLSKEIDLLKSIGFESVQQHDIYPPDKNPWPNTHYYALVCRK